MSRIGKAIINIPAGVKVAINGQNIQVEGPLGKLAADVHELIAIKLEGNELSFSRPNDQKFSRAIHGTTRAIVANMVEGVTKGFQKNLEIVGVGYRVEQKGKDLNLVLGFSHPVIYKAPEGITLTAVDPLKISIKGIDKQKVGQAAAEIRKYRRPEPYKGKGIKYEGEIVRRKQGKKTGK
ncbi:MAG: 50S ribosomal protein L6 [Fibrobacteraceae bacterium]|jgi:large subunit ribosomal protein L6|nr:50S ribosomal protein L6 [Fibrobacteraceae bacterium]MBQ5610311.1 50S ribosomal protein L6 [Fibrobacteraceae bacterium]MEE0875780.1 50S ribosomal protein L6 [Fibrobacteraceae bacterium]MEE1276200.1 50S ribosomal protein L6 [Fibrobacteraceae bacterium]